VKILWTSIFNLGNFDTAASCELVLMAADVSLHLHNSSALLEVFSKIEAQNKYAVYCGPLNFTFF
jgi:hypothetical protein